MLAESLDPLEQLRVALAERYAVERELGHGGMATVYLARDRKHQRLVAIKVLRPELSDLLGRERFLREIEIAAGLQHPNILPLHDSGAVDRLVFYVMPYVEGESLRDRLDREKQLPLEDALRVAAEVADALSYAHSHGVVHRDIKPANILLSGGHALVADFGIARAISAAGGAELTERGIAVGTPAYMSPEQASGREAVDARSDLYSLGCVVYEMLAGEPPFTGRTAQAVMARHMQERPPSLRVVRPTVSLAAQRVIERALAKVPADRYAAAAEFAAALATAQSAPRFVRRRLAAAAVAVILLAGTWRWTSIQRAGRTPDDDHATTSFDPTRIAVLYFDDFSPNGRLAHIAGGLTQDLIDELAQVKGLHVISPEGVKPFRGATALLDSLARSLAVGTIVSGSVAESGDRLRVSVRMVDPVSGVQLLSHTVERQLRDLFALQDQITEEVSSSLRHRLGRELQLRERRAGTRSVAAWELVQRADRLREDALALNMAGHRQSALRIFYSADSVLRRAESLDRTWTVPILARGWLAASVALVTPRTTTGGPGTGATSPLVQWIRVGLQHAEHALAVQSNHPEALELRGVLRFRLWNLGPANAGDTLLETAERDLRLATASRPSLARAWQTLAPLHINRGRFAEAHLAAQRALEADAYLNEVQSVLSLLFFAAVHLGRVDEARSWCEQGLARFPGDPRLSECRLTLLGWFGRGRTSVAEAWRVLTDIERRDSVGLLQDTWAWRRMMLAAVLARSDLRDSAEAVLRRTRSDAGGRPPASGITLLAEAYTRLLLGQREEALRLIAACVQATPRIRFLAAATPWFRHLHTDPRFVTAINIGQERPR